MEKMWFTKQLYMTCQDMNADYEAVQYGLRVEGAWLMECVVTIVICSRLGMLLESILFIIIFTYLRMYCGGYHCKTYLSCGIHYICLVVMSSIVAYHSVCTVLPLIIGFIGLVYLYSVAPVNNANCPLSIDDREQYRLVARKRLKIAMCILIASTQINQTSIVSIAILDLACLCMLQRRIV